MKKSELRQMIREVLKEELVVINKNSKLIEASGKIQVWFTASQYDGHIESISEVKTNKADAKNLFIEDLYNFYSYGPDDISVSLYITAYVSADDLAKLNSINNKLSIDIDDFNESDEAFVSAIISSGTELHRDSGDGAMEVYDKYSLIDPFADPAELIENEDTDFFTYLHDEATSTISSIKL